MGVGSLGGDLEVERFLCIAPHRLRDTGCVQARRAGEQRGMLLPPPGVRSGGSALVGSELFTLGLSGWNVATEELFCVVLSVCHNRRYPERSPTLKREFLVDLQVILAAEFVQRFSFFCFEIQRKRQGTS